MRLAPAIRAARKASQISSQAQKIKTAQKKKQQAAAPAKKKESKSFFNDMPLIIPIPIGTTGYPSQAQPVTESQGTNTQANTSQSWADGSNTTEVLENTQSYAGWVPVPRRYLPSEEKVWENGKVVTRGGGEGLGDGLSGGGAGGEGAEGVGEVVGDFLGGFLDGF
ncbi:hypothetical protein BDZ45DRAFT_690441 [Acephala macrosclerotiorum]|nr:hypothetical protein BDZ45DRAFT_690441 [Acephala macrosclerotiorum]